jgi:hypothetical protein
VKAPLMTKVGIGFAVAAACGFVGLASPAASAATIAHASHASHTSHTSHAKPTTSIKAQARACFLALDDSAEELDEASYDLDEDGAWAVSVQNAQAGMHDPVCAPFAAEVQGPIAQAEPLITLAESQVAAGDVADAENNFNAASGALSTAWWDVYLISVGEA